jgi:hypothetical protein
MAFHSGMLQLMLLNSLPACSFYTETSITLKNSSLNGKLLIILDRVQFVCYPKMSTLVS